MNTVKLLREVRDDIKDLEGELLRLQNSALLVAGVQDDIAALKVIRDALNQGDPMTKASLNRLLSRKILSVR